MWAGFFFCPFVNIAFTASIASHFESQIFVGTFLNAAVKTFMAWVILSSAVMWGYVRYSCNYLAVSIVINALVLLSISWIQR